MVGYQGESGRWRSQRQSGAWGRRIQTGRPRAPARWAGEESTEMMRSRLAMTAAVAEGDGGGSELLGRGTFLQAEESVMGEGGEGG